jgi:hypothetical protein
VRYFMFGSSMGAAGFENLVGHIRDRAVITYGPAARIAAGAAVGIGPVDACGSRRVGMGRMHWVVAHPQNVPTFISHERSLLGETVERI